MDSEEAPGNNYSVLGYCNDHVSKCMLASIININFIHKNGLVYNVCQHCYVILIQDNLSDLILTS